MRNFFSSYVLYKKTYSSNKFKKATSTYNPTHLTDLLTCVPRYFLDLVYVHKYNLYIYIYIYIFFFFHLAEIEEKPTKHTFTKYQNPGH